MDLKDKVVLITGSSRGIGAETAILASNEGAKIIVNFRQNEKEARRIVDEIKKHGGEAIAIKAAVAKLAEVKNMVKKIAQYWGSVDILANNAGVLNAGHILNLNYEEIDETLNVNIRGVIYVTKEVVPHMIKNSDGVIINISSRSGKRGHADHSVYSATKFGVIGFTQALAQDLAGNNIRVYAVCPGTVATDMTGYRGIPVSRVAKRIVDCAKENLGLASGQDSEIYS